MSPADVSLLSSTSRVSTEKLDCYVKCVASDCSQIQTCHHGHRQKRAFTENELINKDRESVTALVSEPSW